MTKLRIFASVLCLCVCASQTSSLEQAKIDYLTPHQEVGEGEAVHLQCLVTASQPGYNVVWQRRTIEASGNVAQQKLARNGVVIEPAAGAGGDGVGGRIFAAVRQHRAGDKRTLEYSLVVKNLKKSGDEGMYDCQVRIFPLNLVVPLEL